MNGKRTLKELSDQELARLILRRLWQYYDSGGISNSRARRSLMIETAFKLMPLPQNISLDEWDEEQLQAEAEARFVRPAPIQLNLFSYNDYSIESFPGQLLARLLIHKVLAWHCYSQTGRDYTFEKPFIQLAARLCPLPWPYQRLPLSKVQQIIDEIKDRTYNWQQIWYRQSISSPM